MPTIDFTAKLITIDSWTIIRLPKSASAKLPSRGICMAEGVINKLHFIGPLEPDGQGSHWLKIGDDMLSGAGVKPGDSVTVALQPIDQWPEPAVPSDLKTALAAAPKAADLWNTITVKARWEWIRWVRSTKQAETRQRRVEVTISKLNAGKRRPCCFNASMCTEPSISHNGVLLETAQ